MGESLWQNWRIYLFPICVGGGYEIGAVLLLFVNIFAALTFTNLKLLYTEYECDNV